MALVAYGSSDSESDLEDNQTEDAPTLSASFINKPNNPDPSSTPITEPSSSSLKFNLPAPKKAITTTFKQSLVEEEDDEFLHKKPTIAAEKPPPPPTIITKKSIGGTVKIMLPALSSFGEHKAKEKPVAGVQLPSSRPTGLIGMLPKPKSESNSFGKTVSGGSKMSSSLVPDSISRPKNVVKPLNKNTIAAKPSGSASSSLLVSSTKSDSENSDDEDFFSLNTEHDLPEVSASEISAMVASKSAQMNMATRKRQHQFQSHDPSESVQQPPEAQTYPTASEPSAAAIDQQAMQALCGNRSRRGQEPINIIDISGDQVMPDRDEWMRTQLTASTEYQPRGLVDQEPGAGTKRKHQITYLAHQAKANEAELQAMWSANRHTKRQTQNKYGF